MGLLATAQQAGWLLDRHERIVRGRIKRGDLPATKEGNRWRVDTDDLERVPGRKIDHSRLAELQMADSRTSERLLARLQVLETELRRVKNRLHLLEARDRPGSDALRGSLGGFTDLEVE